MDVEAEFLSEVRGPLAVVTLNRPKALNALTLAMCRALDAQLAAWAEDPAIAALLIKGVGERAFCAGGDVVAIYESGRGDGTMAAEFFRAEYCLDRRIFHFPKPFIAVIDGITMGGGVGVSVHGSHRVATEHTLFAMPETGIGLFPDVGGSYFLPRLPGQIGIYLGLTGARLKAADCLYAAIATHAMAAEKLSGLEAALAAADWSGNAQDVAGELLDGLAMDPGPAPLAERRAVIDRCFAGDSVEEILAALAAEQGAWAEDTRRRLSACSPTSLKLSLRQLRQGAGLSFDDAMTMEYRLSQACVAGHDFLEGIRAAVIDKDRAPAWVPDRVAAVTPDIVERHFRSLGARDLIFD